MLSATSKRSLLGLAGLALAFAPMSAAKAATTAAGIELRAGNWTGPTSGKMADLGLSDHHSSYTGSSSAGLQDALTTSPGNVIYYSGVAESSLADGLKVFTGISGTGLSWDASYSPFVAADGTVNLNGVAHWYDVHGSAFLRDTLSVSGAADLTSIAFQFHIDGNLSRDIGNLDGEAFSYVALDSGDQNIFTANTFASGIGEYITIDQTVTSGLFNVVNGQVDFSMDLRTRSTYGFTDWASLSGDLPEGHTWVDFFNTVTIADVFGFNSAGQRVSLFSVAGSDGAALPASQFTPVSAVPEPATWAMMIVGFGAVGSMVRTSRRRNAFSAA